MIKANTPFDFVILPGKRHGYANATNCFFWGERIFLQASDSLDTVELNREMRTRMKSIRHDPCRMEEPEASN
ncbi:MAG TPA: hypothetical protein VLM38_10985 [Blastocatellia bacterium]|nr:hypothetical protein [Blastocatellia bacterium]